MSTTVGRIPMVYGAMLVLAFVVVVTVAGGCGERASDPDPENDSPRIVSLSPAATVMLGDLGLASSVVGRHGFDAVAPESVTVVGDQTGLDYERLIGVQPTHIVIEWGARDPPDRLVQLAERRSIPLIPFETLTLADIRSSGQRLAEEFEPHTDGGTVRSLMDRLASLTDPQPSAASAGRVLLIVATSPTVDCLGPGSAHDELLRLGGFTPAIDAGAPWMMLSLEDTITLNPDSIVLVQPGGVDDLDRALGPLAGTPITAVKLGRVTVITDPLSLIPSSNLAGFAETLRDRLLAMGPLPSPRE